MAKTKAGKKIVEIKEHYRRVRKNGKVRKVKVKEHRRSTRN